MDIIWLMIMIAAIAFAAFALTTYVDMLPLFKTIIYFIAVIGIILVLLNAFGRHIPNVLH
jgi:hypothetical protein